MISGASLPSSPLPCCAAPAPFFPPLLPLHLKIEFVDADASNLQLTTASSPLSLSLTSTTLIRDLNTTEYFKQPVSYPNPNPNQLHCASYLRFTTHHVVLHRRAAYTYRILDIITSLNKQSKEIVKIASDIHSIQRVLNSTTSTLERADAVAEEMIFLAASTDTRSHEKTESYRRLRTLRLQFNETVDTVGRIGQLEKLARDLETKIEEESGRLSAEAFRQISLDLNEIRNENNDLMMKIQNASMS